MLTRPASRRIRLSDEQGQTLVLGAFFLTACLVLLAVVTYVGAAYTQRRDLQNVADAAVLAGGQELDGTAAGGTAATAAASTWAEKNNADLDAVPEVTIGGDYKTVFVRVRRTSGFAFPTFGLIDAQISAKARARIASQNLPGPGVVPLGVERADYPGTPGVSMELKDKNIGGSSSNSGLVDLGDGGDQVRDGFKYGSTQPLQPTLNTEPGNKFGQITQNSNSGLVVRIQRAIAHTPRCYSWDDVTDNDALIQACSPVGAGGATESDRVQATSVILIPVIAENFTDLSGNKTIHVANDGTLYILAYFWVDAAKTFRNPLANDFRLNLANPKGAIWGRFILEWETQLAVYDQSNCGSSCIIIDYDPDSIFKVIQLTE